MSDLISVIIPVYNVENTLKRCIKSVLLQTYTNYEILLIDDASPDSSGDICDEYAYQFSNILCVHKKCNEGLGYARNTGIENAMGDYIFFLDSDDEIKPQTLEELMKSVKSHHADICMGGYTRVKRDLEITCIPEVSKGVYKDKDILPLIERMMGPLANGSDALEHMVAKNLYSMDLIRQHEIRFHSEREILAEDFVFSIMYMKKCNIVCFSKYAGYIYYDNENTLTTSYRENRFQLLLNLNMLIMNQLKELETGNECIRRFQRTFLVITQRCMSQETRFNKFSIARKKIKGICKDELVNKYASILSRESNGVLNSLIYHFIKYKQSIVLCLIFLLYNIKKKGREK